MAVVLQVLAYAWDIFEERDAEGFEVSCWADAGKEEDFGRVEGAG